MDYFVKKSNRFNGEIVGETVAAFATLELAEEYTDFKASRGESYAVTFRGEIVYPND